MAMPGALPAFQAFQRDFGLYLRAPHQVACPPGVPVRRAGVYRELLFNNVCGVIDACYPVSRALLGERRWQGLQRRFFVEWRSQSPLFCELPREFWRWLDQADVALPAYLLALAHYEWAELAVDIMQTDPLSAFKPDGDLMQGKPLVAPAHMLLDYQWAVQRISPDYRPRKMVPTQLVVFRKQTERVGFAVINPVTARLLVLLAAGRYSGEEVCLQLAAELQHPNPQVVLQGGAAMLNDLREWGVIYGVLD